MPGLISHRAAMPQRAAKQSAASFSRPSCWFITAVVAIHGGHVVEHIVQLLQVTVFGVSDAKALGLLGYLLQFNGTEEWLHPGPSGGRASRFGYPFVTQTHGNRR
jgi:hypothetical protein